MLDSVHNWNMSHSTDKVEPTTGRRERKRRQTHSAIERAAVALACEVGYANVTVVEVCERADVSRSTFFNYMATLDAAIFGHPLTIIEDERAMAILEADPHNLGRAIHRIALESVGDDEIDPVVMAGRRKLLREQPETAVHWEATFTRLRHQELELATRWLIAHPELRRLPDVSVVREAMLHVTASGAAAAVLMDEWADIVLPVDQEQALRVLAADYDRAIADLRIAIAEK